ncbi:MAG: DUF2569 family protein [Flavobacteriales bacterium]|nr:DUF2569 family protein [Flavobacteriales bacterium]
MFIAFCIGVCISGHCGSTATIPAASGGAGKRPWSIGSFLILPAIGLCINRCASSMICLPMMGPFPRHGLHQPAATEHPVWIDLAMHLSRLMGFGQLSFTILWIVLYFQHRTSVPLLMKVLHIGTLAWIRVDFWIYEAMDLEEALGKPTVPRRSSARSLPPPFGTGVPPERAGPVHLH